MQMSFRNNYPDYAAIEAHIRHARAERAVATASWIAGAVIATVRGLKRLGAAAGRGLAAERDRRSVASDAFLKRSVPKY
jgi:hypothetical protein